jgi:hypothetical protein
MRGEARLDLACHPAHTSGKRMASVVLNKGVHQIIDLGAGRGVESHPARVGHARARQYRERA